MKGSEGSKAPLMLISMQDERLAAVEMQVKCISSDVKEIRLALLGDEQVPGMKLQIDRLEQKEQTRSKILWFLGITFIAGLLERFLR